MPCMHVGPAPFIDESLLKASESSSVIGRGCFGSCARMVYKDAFGHVLGWCTKMLL